MLMGTHPSCRHRCARAGRQRTNNKRKHTAVNQARMCEGGVAIPYEAKPWEHRSSSRPEEGVRVKAV